MAGLGATELPFRIRIGVTGHRALGDPERVAAAVRDALAKRIWELFDKPIQPQRRSVSLAFTVLTPLAEGADRLAAIEVLKTPGAEIEVVLPLEKEDYLRDFAGAESKTEFEELCRKARKVAVLKPPPDAAGPERLGADEERKRAYEAAGRHVVDHSDVLIAIWDGKPSRGRGGTAEIVDYARKKRKPLMVISSEPPFRLDLERGEGLSARAYDKIAAFVRFSVPDESLRTYGENVFKEIFSNPEGDDLSALAKATIEESLIPWYVRASLIAKGNQRLYHRSGWTVYALTPLAVAAVAAGILVPAWALAAFLVEFLILLTIYAVIKLADRAGVHKKWIESRFLAEKIRAAIFLTACRVNPVDVSRYQIFESPNRGEEWVVRIFDEIILRAGASGAEEKEVLGSSIAFIRTRWIAGQIGFHAAKAERSGRMSRRLERSGRAVFLAAIGAAAWHLVSYLLGHRGVLEVLEKPVVFLAIVLPAIGAAVGGVRAHREYSRLEKQSRRMEAALRELDGKFAAATGFADFESLLNEAERLMLQETLDWLTLMTFARVEAI